MRYNNTIKYGGGVPVQIINEPKNALNQAIQGIQRAYPNLKWVPTTFGCYDRTFNDDQVPLIAGGGSGHDPAHWGYVGHGMLTAAIMGQIFQPPTPTEIVKVTKQVTHQQQAFFIVKNFPADVAAFTEAQQQLVSEHWHVGMCIVADDISVDNDSLKQRRRGVAGTIFVQKILGAAAVQGATIAELTTLATALTPNVKTIGVAASGSQIPGKESASFTLKTNEIYYGIGIHGEAGYRREPFQSSELLAQELVSKLKLNFTWKPDDHYAVLVNSLGGTTPMETMVFNNDVHELLELASLQIDFNKVGTFLTSNGMHGLSLTLLKLADPTWLTALKYPVTTAAWPN